MIQNDFIFSTKTLNIIGFKQYVFEDKFLYLHEKANVEILLNENGNLLSFIIGDYFRLNNETHGFEKLHLVNSIEKEIYYWSGRFVLFVNGIFYNDFAALYHIYYSVEHGIVSNSLRVLNNLGFRKDEEIISEFWKNSETLDWVPPPKTIFKEFRVMLPFQSINSNFCMDFLNYNKISKIDMSDIHILDKTIKDYVIYLAENLKGNYQLALTGGHDSRMLLYAFLTNTKKIEAVLFDHQKLSFSDLLGFKFLSKNFKICSNFIKKSILYKCKYEIRQKQFDEYCQQSCKEVDRHFFSTRQLFSEKKRIMFRANVLSEIFRTKNYNKFDINNVSADGMIENLKKKYNFGPEKEKALRLWYDMRVQDSIVFEEFKDWRKLFWLDQRSTGWVGYIDAAVQVANYQYINLYNSPAFFYLFQNYSERLDCDQDFQEVFLRNNKPDLLEIPFNVKDIYFIRNKHIRNMCKYLIKLTTS